jgi:dihydropteroate synthase
MNCKGKLIDLSTPKVMGILNITPNSFYDGGKFIGQNQILQQAEKMILEGAALLDIGAYSSKPKAEFVSEKDELDRILPVLELILNKFPETILSIDTFRSNVAKSCIENGANLINDISASSQDHKMMETVAKYGVPYIMMHMRGDSQTMQSLTNYDNIVKEIIFYFSEKIVLARSLGINDLILDPGFGFAKTLNQNFEVLQKLELFQMLELPILAGISRKSMVYKTLKTTAENALNGTSILNTIALSKDAKILRVHDVQEAVECVKLYQKIINLNS